MPTVEIPVEIGAPVYIAVHKCDANIHYCPLDGGYGTSRCDKEPCEAYISEEPFELDMLNNWNKTVFQTKEQAESFLKKHKDW